MQRTQKRRSSFGFTLVEVTVALIIALTLLAISLPNLNKVLARHQLNTAARHLVADIREGRERAQTVYAGHRIEFGQGRYEIYEVRDSGDRLLIRQVVLPRQVDLLHTNFAGDVLRFDTDGEPHRPGTITFRNRVSGDLRYVIISRTGRVRVSSEPP